jgi:hypothetical protein
MEPVALAVLHALRTVGYGKTYWSKKSVVMIRPSRAPTPPKSPHRSEIRP